MSVYGHARRDVERIVLDEEGSKVCLYLKREWNTYLKDRVWNWIDGLGWSTKSRREWQALKVLRDAGVGCAEPIAIVERNGLRPQGYLLIRDIPDALLLGQFLTERHATMPLQERRQFAAHLGREVARLHGAGVDHPDLFAKHILVSARAEPGQPPHIWFIDMQRSTTRLRVSPSQQVRDLASLDATIALTLANAGDRLTFLESYLSVCPTSVPLRRFAIAIMRRSQRLQRRRKIRAIRDASGSGGAPL